MTRDTALDALIAETEKRVAHLRRELSEEEDFLSVLRERRSRSGSNGIANPVMTTEVVSGSLAALIVDALRVNDRPMRAVEIVSAIHDNGKVAGELAAVQNNVYATLKRREDLFKKVDRGTYELRKRE